ncbi:MAG: TIGR00269 family protein [Candidatus Thorarchaeota archaeon]|nr:MAG: TIGR00269 family protein [Candidatus Thorarchaeota archaeon]
MERLGVVVSMQSGCSKCGKPAVYLRRYTSEHLCGACLVETTIDRVRKTINKHKMLNDKDRIAVAISGGKDSAVLLHILHNIESAYPDSEIVPVTIDEGIQGYRNESLESAQELSRSLDFKLEVLSFEEIVGYSLDEIVKRRTSSSLGACSYCGVFRRRALNVAAQNLEANVIALGHNLDDEIQTVLMNILRGDSARIARTNVPRHMSVEGFVPRIKPIAEITERDVVAYAHHLKLPYHDVPCPYAEEAYRNDIRSFLNDMEYRRPGTLLATLRSAEAMTKAFRQNPTKWEFTRCQKCDTPSPSKLCKVCEMLESIGG